MTEREAAAEEYASRSFNKFLGSYINESWSREREAVLYGIAWQKEREKSPRSYCNESLEVSALDCGDNSCLFAKNKGGMRTNGGCRCFELHGFERSQVRSAQLMLPEILRLRAELAQARGEVEMLKGLFTGADTVAQINARDRDCAIADCDSLRSQLEAAKEALKYYADTKIMDQQDDCESKCVPGKGVVVAAGKRARKALAALTPEGEK